MAHERISEAGERVLIITNFTPVPHEEFQLGMPIDGEYQLLLNTDDEKYGGSGFDVLSSAKTEELESEGLPQSLLLRVPPLATIFYKLNA